jgi:SWI/SNF-related matrix-associated actin-dependent regulator of chromatin subfamily A member 5
VVGVIGACLRSSLGSNICLLLAFFPLRNPIHSSGKTLQSISILVYMLEYQGITGPHLIVVPKSTLSNWMNELARWAPTLKPVKFHGDKATREAIVRDVLKPGQRDEEREWHLVVTTYEVCNIEKNALNKFAWSYLIIDEAHRLKNEASAFSKTVRAFETRYRILLTGTPLQNSLHELWALLNFLVPDVFESAEQFDEWFNLDIEDNDEKNKLISQLHKILRPFMLRRLKADVEKSLLPKHETILFTGMSAVQKKLYRDILIRDIDAIQGKSSGGARTAILNIVMQLRKCAGHPYLFPGVEDRTLPPLGEHLVENCGKMVVLDKLLRRLHERGHRVLLFTQMTKILDIMEDYLVMRRFAYCRIDGNTSYDDREGFIESFNAPNSEKFIFLLSTRAGGLGINLQTADVVILYDSDWNPQADLQAQDRAHRIGQKRAVQVFRLVTEHTIEEKIVERAQQKLKLDAMVVQQGRLNNKDKLSRDELLAAVRFGADKIFKSKDSSITDDDIDLILNAGRRKTEELNEKLQTADKGDLLDFKLDGSSVQTFEGVDYSGSAIAQAKAEAEMSGIFDIGKRERKEANYNENSLYHQQIKNLQGNVVRKPKKKREFRLPRHLRLPRMEEWQMYDRPALIKIQEEEEKAFKDLPEEEQKKATAKPRGADDSAEIQEISQEPEEPFELPPLLSEERQIEKTRLLAEGFSTWNRRDYSAFVRASARFGRHETEKIALEVGKFETEASAFATAYWGKVGESRISEHEYDRVTKLIERGEKKIGEIYGLERATSVLVSHFDNPWQELEFTHVNCKDKMFTIEEDRHLLCWTRKVRIMCICMPAPHLPLPF